MKNKIKTVSVILALVILIPNIALASWWNPFSWNIFHKKEVITPIQIENTETVKTSEEKITELQKEINDLKKQQPVTTSPKTISTVKEVKKVVPTVDNSAIIKAKVEAELKIKEEQQAKQKAEQDALIAKQKEEDQAKIDEENEARLNAEQKKSDALKAINLKIAKLNAQYPKDKAEMQLNKNGVGSFALQSQLSDLYDKYLDDYNTLMSEYQLVKYSN